MTTWGPQTIDVQAEDVATFRPRLGHQSEGIRAEAQGLSEGRQRGLGRERQ